MSTINLDSVLRLAYDSLNDYSDESPLQKECNFYSTELSSSSLCNTSATPFIGNLTTGSTSCNTLTLTTSNNTGYSTTGYYTIPYPNTIYPNYHYHYYYPWIQIIERIQVIEKEKCNDLKKSVPNYPVSNFSVDENGNSLIEIAVTGFNEDEISVNRENLKIIVTGKKKDIEEDARKYLYKNIACRNFELSYDGNEKWNFDSIKVTINKGILSILISLLEEYKPIRQSIPISK